MTCVYRKTVFLEEHSTAARSDLYRDVVSGLSCLSKELPPKYFYDDTGSGKHPHRLPPASSCRRV